MKKVETAKGLPNQAKLNQTKLNQSRKNKPEGLSSKNRFGGGVSPGTGLSGGFMLSGSTGFGRLQSGSAHVAVICVARLLRALLWF